MIPSQVMFLPLSSGQLSVLDMLRKRVLAPIGDELDLSNDPRTLSVERSRRSLGGTKKGTRK
jgi:hypothetical protein